MEAVDDVHRVGNARHGKTGEDHREGQPDERRIQPRQANPVQHGTQDPAAQRARDHAGHQAVEDTHPLGHILHQSAQESRQAA